MEHCRWVYSTSSVLVRRMMVVQMILLPLSQHVVVLAIPFAQLWSFLSETLEAVLYHGEGHWGAVSGGLEEGPLTVRVRFYI